MTELDLELVASQGEFESVELDVGEGKGDKKDEAKAAASVLDDKPAVKDEPPPISEKKPVVAAKPADEPKPVVATKPVEKVSLAKASSMQLIKAGKLKALAVTSSQRSAALPDVPTVEQAGGASLKGFEASSWFGLLAPAGTSMDIVNRIQQETAKALNAPAVKERLLANGAIPSGNTPAEFARLIDAELKKWQPVVKASGAKVD